MKKIIFTTMIMLSFTLSGCARGNAAALPPVVTPAPTSLVEAPALVVQASPTSAPQAIINVPVDTPTPQAPAPGGETGLCSNPYYPVVGGATWVYDIEDLPQAVHTMSVEEEGKFQIAVVDVDSAVVLEGRCTEQGIILMEAGMGGSFYSESGSSSVDTQFSEGVTLPNNLKVGDSWSQTSGFLAESDDGETSLNSRTIINYTAVGIETVTVPAGTFEALKIEQSGSMSIMGNEIRTQGTLWYVRGIGNVKAESGLADGDTFLIQLVSYDIP